MIIEQLTKPPFIHFGLMKQTLTVNAGENFKIFQKNLYLDISQVKINDVVAKYENNYTINTPGVYNYETKIDNSIALKEIIGNTITVTVV